MDGALGSIVARLPPILAAAVMSAVSACSGGGATPQGALIVVQPTDPGPGRRRSNWSLKE